jgi:hypothetical protein
MAKASKQVKRKQRPVKKQPLLSTASSNTTDKAKARTRKNSKSKNSNLASRKSAASKQKAANSKKMPKSTAKLKSRTSVVQKKRKLKPKVAQKHIISLPLGRHRKLVLAINQSAPRSKRKSVNKKSSKSSQKKASKLLEGGLSALCMIGGIVGIIFFGWQAIGPQ